MHSASTMQAFYHPLAPWQEFFENANDVVKDAKLTTNWVMGELSKLLNQEQLDIENSPVNAQAFGELLVRIKDDTINGKTAKRRFPSHVER